MLSLSSGLLTPSSKGNNHKPLSTISTAKAKNKHMLQDVYANEAWKENEIIGKMTEQKHEWWLFIIAALMNVSFFVYLNPTSFIPSLR